MGRSWVTESAPTTWSVALTGPSMSIAMTRIEAALVQEADGIGIADRSVGELHRDRIAVMQHVDVEQRPRQQRIEHDRADGRDHGGVGDGAWPHDTVDRRLAGLAPVNVDVVVVTDQAGFPPILVITVSQASMQRPLDASSSVVADIDAGRARRHALAGRCSRRRLASARSSFAFFSDVRASPRSYL